MLCIKQIKALTLSPVSSLEVVSFQMRVNLFHKMNQYVLHQSHIILLSNNFRLVRLTGTQEKISFILEFL